MASEGSVAPKERINITYKPSMGDGAVAVELPLKIMVLGDFTQHEDERPIEDRAPINVDKDTFADVLKAHKLSVDINVREVLSSVDSTDNLAVKLRFESLADFEPDAIIENVPELKSLLALRDALKALKGPLGNIPDFRKKLQQLVSDEDSRQKLLIELGLDKN